jgi:hypothetical protein
LGAALPIHRLIETGVFAPEEVAMMSGVFEDVLGLVDRTDPMTTMVASKVIELAQAGERDPDRLKRLTLEAFEGSSN